MSNDNTARFVLTSISAGMRLASLAATVLITGCVQPASDPADVDAAVKEYNEPMSEKKTTKPRPHFQTDGPGTAGRMKQLLQQSRSDLAERLKIDQGDITVVEARHVIWPDSSAGCPTPGFNYLQVLTKGVLIRLQVGERTYQYHGGGSGPAFECKKPSPQSPPSLYEES